MNFEAFAQLGTELTQQRRSTSTAVRMVEPLKQPQGAPDVEDQVLMIKVLLKACSTTLTSQVCLSTRFPQMVHQEYAEYDEIHEKKILGDEGNQVQGSHRSFQQAFR